MDVSLTLIRIIFLFLCTSLSMTYTLTISKHGVTIESLALGIFSGLVFGAAIISLDTSFKRFNLRSLNISILGMFFGYLLGQAILLILSGVLGLGQQVIAPETETLLKATIYLVTIYLGMIMTARAADELYISIPFFKFKSSTLKKKDILIDSSVLSDARVIDLASSGLVDNHLIIPRFIVNDLYTTSEKGDENARAKARKSLDIIKKLESLPSLDLRYADNNFTELKNSMDKMLKLARMTGANILTADINHIQQGTADDIRVIKFQQLCSSLKPLSQTGEFINIKIQRYGKEPRRGVGYLDDGTMVVVNGGAEYIGETIRSQVLSVKHTSSGRMIFCNALEENLFQNQELNHNDYSTATATAEHSHSESY